MDGAMTKFYNIKFQNKSSKKETEKVKYSRHYSSKFKWTLRYLFSLIIKTIHNYNINPLTSSDDKGEPHVPFPDSQNQEVRNIFRGVMFPLYSTPWQKLMTYWRNFMSLYSTKVFLGSMKSKPHTALGRLLYTFVKFLNERIKTLKALDNVLKLRRCQFHVFSSSIKTKQGENCT